MSLGRNLVRAAAPAAWFVCCVALCHARVLPAQTAPADSIRINADAHAKSTPLVHYWSKVVGAGRANEALRATWQEELHTAHEYDGFEYVRFHGLFHDDMFVYREDPDGRPIYNWQYIDDVFDRMLAQGVRPFVELGFVPAELATVKDTDFWWKANGSPPTDNAKWAALVDHFVRHCEDRYGRDEVRRWYFEVWNEPNLRYFFRNGTEAQYFELYRVTALTVKGVDPALRVGGPATSNFRLVPDPSKDDTQQRQQASESGGGNWQPIWVADFLKYCAENHLPLDFISTHPYPTDFPIDASGSTVSRLRRSVDSTRQDLTTLRRMVDASAFPHAEIDLTEWNSSPSPLDHSHDSLAAATFIVKTNLESAGLVDALSYWTFTDVFEEERRTDSIFHGGFGLINYQQIVKPAFHAYRFMNRLGDEELAATVGAMVTRHAQTGLVTAIAYNYPKEMKEALPKTATVEDADRIVASGSPRDLTIDLTGLPPGAVFTLETLDATHGNVVEVWEKMGKPDPPDPAETAALKAAAWATSKETLRADATGHLSLHRKIAPWSVLLLDQFGPSAPARQ
jgi:xylan 1,4-beta-xylosidase